MTLHRRSLLGSLAFVVARLLNARDAADHGATIRSRTKAIAAARRAGGWDIVVEDCKGRETIHADALVNAAGPRLGGRPNLLDPFPTKPKGLHLRTYNRLKERAEAAERKFATARDRQYASGLVRSSSSARVIMAASSAALGGATRTTERVPRLTRRRHNRSGPLIADLAIDRKCSIELLGDQPLPAANSLKLSMSFAQSVPSPVG